MENKYCAGQIFFIELVKENLSKIYIQNKHKQEDYLVFVEKTNTLKIGDFVVVSKNIDNQNSEVVKILDLI